MEKFISALMAITLLLLWGLMLLGRRYIQRGAPTSHRPAAGDGPPVAVIIPVAGVSPGLEENLRSRLTQDYPHYKVIFVTRSLEDPATGVISKLLADFPQARQVMSGPARSCGQKNHNLLAGVRVAPPDVDILVFADANQMAPTHWLSALVQPLVRGEAMVTSSFHHILPQNNRLASLGRMFTVLMIYLGKGVAAWDQPWGGSTAVRRDFFHSFEIPRLWSRTVVDDVTLARKLKQAGIRLRAAPGAVLATPAAESLASWEAWLTRQLLYLKFYFPWSWLLAGVGIFVLLGLVTLSVGQILLAAFGAAQSGLTFQSSIFLLALTLLFAFLRLLHPSPGPWRTYLAAGYMTLVMGAWVHARTWFKRELCWRHLVYTVDRQGLVTKIQEL